ncbi:DUF3850 domain-containing protein [Salmonella enterica subsp. enterica serovar Braenderup]|nr:DUF3850 domain-containing protein [Salmonella enterica subsp. enterica serovar Braenderup]EIS0562880.1 DUF3850 domain-containing protein [Salmonella enterica]EJQ8257335.1 DUF3850 domain-containing protein [Salmonella enterica]
MTNNKLTGVEHNLKIYPEYFAAVVAGVKRAELRFNDRNYQIGDVLNLCEWADNAFTGAFVSVVVTHVCELPSVPGYALLSFELQKCRKVDSAEPAPIVPETLPCSVELKPGLIIGKGCKTETLLSALQRRYDYNAEIDAMTPEERAERDAGIEAFKAMLPTPADSQGRSRAPVVPPAIEPDYEVIKAIIPTANPDEYACCIAADMWNACRAAMLQGAEPVSQTYNLPELIEGMEVSIDVSTCDADAGNRYFGTVTEVSELYTAKNGYILLVQDAKPNFDVNGNPPVIPDGWVMVPKEPTRQMMAQGHFAMKGTDRGKFRRIYQAMITAAPALNKGGINAE